MHLDLTPEIEHALEVEAKATGLTPADLTLRVLSSYAERVLLNYFQEPSLQAQRNTTVADALPVSSETPPEILGQRRAAAERIVSRRKASAATFGPPAGVGWREWIHEGHRY